MKLKKRRISKSYCEPQEVGLCVSSEEDRETPINLGEVSKEITHQKIYCKPKGVGLCVSPEVDGRKSFDLDLFDLILYVPSTIFQLCRTGLPGLNQY